MEQTNLLGRFLLILVVTSVLVAAFVFMDVKLGQDLKGGTTLRFSLDLASAAREAEAEGEPFDAQGLVGTTIKVIRDRIDKYGLAEIGLVPLGDDKFEIQLPAGSEGDVESIRDVVTALGKLEFRIEVLPSDNARYQGWEHGTPPRLTQRDSYPWQGTATEFNEFKQKAVEAWLTARDAGEPHPRYADEDGKYILRRSYDATTDDVNSFHVLESLKDRDYDFDGQILIDPVTAQDPETGQTVVLYKVKTHFQRVFAEWTEANRGLPMAIVLNEEYRTAPVINSTLRDNVQITLGRGSYSQIKKDAEELTTVLQTGALKVKPRLESVNKIGARLAGESRERGILAVIVAFVLVLLFMMIFYRMQGVVANVALLLNVVLLVGTLAFFQAALTLPGIAGIVLTLGMAVDANILICERIREERNAGRALVRAVSEGYDRALTTIVDANVTSLITAAFLFKFGSGPVKGFAITLFVGLIVSMFTAIFVTRTINEWLLKIGLFKEIRMLGKGIPPKISWVGLRRIFAPLSAAGVVFGLLVFATEDKYTLYDVEFTGGFKLQARFQKETSVDDVKAALDSGVRDIKVETADADEQLVVQAGPYREAEVVAVGRGGETREGVEITIQRGLSQEGVPEEDRLDTGIQSQAFEEYVRAGLAANLRPGWLEGGILPFKADDGTPEELRDLDGGKVLTIAIVDPDDLVTAERLQQGIIDDMPYWEWRGTAREKRPSDTLDRRVVAVKKDADDELGMLRKFEIHMKSLTRGVDAEIVESDPDKLGDVLAEFLGGKEFKQSLVRQLDAEIAAARAEGSPPAEVEALELLKTKIPTLTLSEAFPSVDVIGPQVAQKLKNDAMIALALSLVGIIAYIWFRFSSRSMGLAAVICLFHDVAITLGVVAIANYAGLVDAKINLPMVAAFLTLVGYSVNDTVVVFDRIRENRGKKRVITREMIDLSINQTLARTIKTSVTFLLATLALFAINVGQRNVLEGFAFLLIVGSLVGTYSTVAIASPLLLFLPWLWKRIGAFRPRFAPIIGAVTRFGTMLLGPIAALWSWVMAKKPEKSTLGTILWILLFLLVLGVLAGLAAIWAVVIMAIILVVGAFLLLWTLVFAAITFLIGVVLFPVWALTERPEAAAVPAVA